MKKLSILLIICFFFFKSYALNDDNKAASSATPTKVRLTYRDVIFGAPYFADDFTAYVCEGYSRTFTASSPGATSFIWYKNDVVIEGATTNQLTVTTAGKYKAKPNNASMSNTVTVVMVQKPSKPTITFTE
jgi:hypothetical protein